MQNNTDKTETQYKTFKQFYPFYLSQHENAACRRLHFIGSCSVIALTLMAIGLSKSWLLWTLPIAGYGFAWIGHFAFEKNRPATFTHPFYSLMGDWMMFWEILTGKISITSQ